MATESVFEGFQALLGSYDTAQAQRWREEDRAWRAQDMEWRQREQYYAEHSAEHMCGASSSGAGGPRFAGSRK